MRRLDLPYRWRVFRHIAATAVEIVGLLLVDLAHRIQPDRDHIRR